MFQKVRLFLFAVMSLAAGVLAPVGFMPVHAQDIVPYANRGVPEDWSHRHVIIRNADTMKEASGKGSVEFEKWRNKLRDPRFVRAVANKTIEVQPTANKIFSGQQLAFADRFDRKPKLSSLTRDWSVPLGSATSATTGTGVGTKGMFPAKYTWDINATPSCTNDFVVFPTMTPGANSGVSATQIGTFVAFTSTTPAFTNVSNGNGTITIANPANGSSITLKGSTTASPTSNTGLNFYMGDADTSNSPPYYADNLAAAINRNGFLVGVSATSANGVVTIIANQAGTAGNNITVTKSPSFTNLTFGGTTLSGGSASGVQPTLVAYNNLYKTLCTQSPSGLPNIFWSVNTGNGAVVETSPALSLDGSQVAFVQRTITAAGPTASLVLLKWKGGASTVAPTEVAPGSYRSCSIASTPCMTKFPLNANNQNSSPYVDYANDVIYVGDAAGKLHKFTGVFNGNPAEVVSNPWPVTVSAGNMLSSPVFDSTSGRVFVGSDVSERVDDTDTGTGGQLHAVHGMTGAVVDSGQIAAYRNNVSGENVKMTGVRDGVIVDSLAQKVYAFLESDITTTCGGVTTCKAVNQFDANFVAGNTGAASQLGRGQIPGRVLYIGQFDDAYWSSTGTSPTGNLYACGSVDGGNSRAPTLWRIPITNNVVGTPVSMMSLTSVTDPARGLVGASCSPTSIIKNGSNEYLFVGVTANPLAIGTCSGTGGCIYMVRLQSGYDATTTPDATVPAYNNTAANQRYLSVSTATALNVTEANVATTIQAATTFTTMTISQLTAAGAPQNNPANVTTVYRLNDTGGNGNLSCTINSGANSCQVVGTSSAYAINDTISVRVRNTGTATSASMRVRVVLKGPAAGTTPTTGLAAPGGTSGIVVDNVSTQAGTSQVYYSTLQRPGNAIQASQAGLN